jgi:glycosyltransferase involved in cell wall biosynthesis
MNVGISNALVSVIIPYYYGSNHIRNAIRSAQNQTYENIEIIVVNDSPNDDQFYELDFGDCEILQHDENKGMYAARNTGWKNAGGEYITFLDQDDVLYPKKIEKQVEFFVDNPEFGICLTNVADYFEVDDKKSIRDVKVDFEDLDQNEIWEYMFKIWEQEPLPITSEMVQKDVLQSLEGYDESMYGCGDRDLIIRACDRYKIKIIDEPLMERRHHAENASKSNMKLISDREIITKKLIELHPKLEGLLPSRITYLSLMSSAVHLSNREYTLAVHNLMKAISNKPIFAINHILKSMTIN